MKNVFQILSLFILLNTQYSFVNAQQNLVPNPSFEDTVECPDVFSNIELATGWINPNSYSPDYFHSCANSGNPNFGVPNNKYGFQNARTGIAYAGIYLPVNAGTNSREYIQIELTDTLIIGLEYVIKFHVSLSDSSIFSVNSLGAFLSDTAIYNSSSTFFNIIPHIVNNLVLNPLVNPSVWYEISDTVFANGGERFITIGNFEADSVADTTGVVGGSFPSDASYYYIDDVSIKRVFTNGIFNRPSFHINIFPNPVKEILNISSGDFIESIYVTTIEGKILLKENPYSNNFQIDFSSYPKGIYFLKTFSKNEYQINKIINQ